MEALNIVDYVALESESVHHQCHFMGLIRYTYLYNRQQKYNTFTPRRVNTNTRA